mgnify:CR=1 FL=1
MLEWISADGKTALGEWCVFQMVRHFLDPSLEQVRLHTAAVIGREFGHRLLSCVVDLESDDLDAALSGLVATGLPANDVCGAGSQLSGTSVLTFTGGTLAPGGICTFSATVQVPVGAVAGVYTNTTSAVSADIATEIDAARLLAERGARVTLTEARTAAALVLVSIGLFALLINARPLTTPRKFLVGSMAAAFLLVLVAPSGREFFEIGRAHV